jgi:hypothetical protein
METPLGLKRRAFVPIPFVEPEDPETPAKVVTEAVEMIIFLIK